MVARTPLPRYNHAAMAEQEEIYWTAGFLNERFSAPVSPLGWSVIGPLFEEYALRQPLRYMGYPRAGTSPATRLVHGHPYTNVLIFQILYKPFPDALVPADAVRYFPEGDSSWRLQAPYPAGTFDPRLIASLLAHFVRDPYSWSPLNYQAWERYTHRHDADVALLNRALDRAASAAEIWRVVSATDQVHATLVSLHRWSLTYADVFYRWLAGMAGADAQALISDVRDITQRANAELRELSALAERLGLDTGSAEGLAAARQNPEFEASFEALIRTQGHRSFSLDISQPTLAERPEQFLALLGRPVVGDQGTESWQTVARRVRKGLLPQEKPVFDLVLALARRYACLRENERYHWHKSLAVLRRAFLRLGGMLRAEKVIESTEGVFYATRPELESYFAGRMQAADLGRVISERKREWQEYEEEYLRSPTLAYPAFLKGDRPLAAAPARVADTWQGRGVSPGRAAGTVRVILEPGELGRVAPGEILVAPATDPGWTPVFARLGGLVLERGGVLAHGAIVAREHHLPAVAGIPHITEELADGDRVEVDGLSGTVRRIAR